MMAAGVRLASALAGWRGYAASALVGAGAAWFVLGAFHGREMAELRLERARDDLAGARQAIEQTNADLATIAASARAAAAAGPQITASIGAITKALKDATPLPAGCRPDDVRVRNLTDAVRAARGAAAR
ncbi:hypothetical protein GHR37_27345 [Achromobacter xylosoxidans]|nr:hypothetical protein [Achromobacter xylosoxidans]